MVVCSEAFIILTPHEYYMTLSAFAISTPSEHMVVNQSSLLPLLPCLAPSPVHLQCPRSSIAS